LLGDEWVSDEDFKSEQDVYITKKYDPLGYIGENIEEKYQSVIDKDACDKLMYSCAWHPHIQYRP